MVPCLLCGQIHELKIHSYPKRKVRLPGTCVNVTILIVLIMCATAKKRRTQYTKRILPPFLVPFCVIRRDLVLDYLRGHPGGAVGYQMAIRMLGALDRRTTRRHLAEGMELIRRAIVELAGLLAVKAFFGTMPQRKLTDGDFEYLAAASEELNRAGRRASGATARSIPELVCVHIAGVFRRHRGPPAISMTSVLRALVFHDTG